MNQDEMKATFLETYDQYAGDIFRFCSMKISNREVAEDITQEVFMRLWQALRDGTELRNPRALLYTIARNLVIDWYRKKKESSLDVLTDMGIDFGSEDHKGIVRDAEMQEVLKVINQLDEPSRDALLMRYVEGLSPQEIAEITEETANVISVRINRAIKKVQDLIHAI
ncbi:MAG: polymerase sigma-70 factor, subfamily [Parcubacteria group bacterium]|nr:polymerase sigma-70 factor, subfamily [Parcubacteria group bacterium]